MVRRYLMGKWMLVLSAYSSASVSRLFLSSLLTSSKLRFSDFSLFVRVSDCTNQVRQWKFYHIHLVNGRSFVFHVPFIACSIRAHLPVKHAQRKSNFFVLHNDLVVSLNFSNTFIILQSTHFRIVGIFPNSGLKYFQKASIFDVNSANSQLVSVKPKLCRIHSVVIITFQTIHFMLYSYICCICCKCYICYICYTLQLSRIGRL